MSRWTLGVVVAVSLGACYSGGAFDSPPISRAPSADAALLFLSASWASAPGHGREILALNADGTHPERLTTCAEASSPCHFVRVAVSPERDRIVALRSAPGGDTALYFVNLSRSAEQQLVASAVSVDWSPTAVEGPAPLIYSSALGQPSGNEDLFTCDLHGALVSNRTQTPTVRERGARFHPLGHTAVYERIDDSGVSRIYLYYPETPLTSGTAPGPALPGTPYVVGGDADPAFSPDGGAVAFRRLTGTGNGGLGTWDLMAVDVDGTNLRTLATGPVHRGAPDWGRSGIIFVETDASMDEARLVLVLPDGSGARVLRVEPAGYGMAAPRWLPEG